MTLRSWFRWILSSSYGNCQQHLAAAHPRGEWIFSVADLAGQPGKIDPRLPPLPAVVLPLGRLARFREALSGDRCKHTLRSARDRTATSYGRTLQQALHLPGDIVECGVFRGGTALLAARTIVEERGDDRPALDLFDSFQGMAPDISSEESCPSRLRANLTPCPGATLVGQLLRSLRFHVRLHPRDVSAGSDNQQIAWAHVELDIYTSIRDAIAYLYPRLVPGGFLIFDDYGSPSCPGARRAIDEAFADRPEMPICLPTEPVPRRSRSGAQRGQVRIAKGLVESSSKNLVGGCS